VAELADAPGLGPGGHYVRVGSTPSARILYTGAAAQTQKALTVIIKFAPNQTANHFLTAQFFFKVDKGIFIEKEKI
jgi:hypothetical protein